MKNKPTKWGVKVFDAGILLRLLTIVPFVIKEDEILPFPLVVDNRAPGTLYLGIKMKKTLEELNAFHGIANFHGPYRVLGTFTWKERTLADPLSTCYLATMK